MLAARGYHVVGSTGKQEEHTYLRELGAAEVLDRSETIAQSGKVLERERWAGAVDCVGGATLAYVLRTLRYGAAVAATDLRPPHLEESIAREVELADVESVLDDIMQGQIRGRVVVRVSDEGS
jgi:NADPH:quinone reductase-like Zn-dependent oxidoreductase